MFLLDINIWLALSFEIHAHHNICKEWFNKAPQDSCFFCRMTQQGFLRLSTNPAVFGKEAITTDMAWKVYGKLINDPRVSYMDEPENLEKLWRSFTAKKKFSHRLWNDAFLAALARSSNKAIVSLDNGFSQFPGLKSINFAGKPDILC